MAKVVNPFEEVVFSFSRREQFWKRHQVEPSEFELLLHCGGKIRRAAETDKCSESGFRGKMSSKRFGAHIFMKQFSDSPFLCAIYATCCQRGTPCFYKISRVDCKIPLKCLEICISKHVQEDTKKFLPMFAKSQAAAVLN